MAVYQKYKSSVLPFRIVDNWDYRKWASPQRASLYRIYWWNLILSQMNSLACRHLSLPSIHTYNTWYSWITIVEWTIYFVLVIEFDTIEWQTDDYCTEGKKSLFWQHRKPIYVNYCFTEVWETVKFLENTRKSWTKIKIRERKKNWTWI